MSGASCQRYTCIKKLANIFRNPVTYQETSWTFLTYRARVLLCVAHDPGVRLRDIAASLNITERSAFGIITDLVEAGYLIKEKNGRRNRYNIQAHPPAARSGRTGTHRRRDTLRRLAGGEVHDEMNSAMKADGITAAGSRDRRTAPGELGSGARLQLPASFSLARCARGGRGPGKVPRGLPRLGHAGRRLGNVGVEQRAAHVGDVDDSD